ncbi:MAG: excinuclease ABC subunit UvrA [Patescibacteria group bacterium]
MENTIKIRGARQHNLKNINLEIPKNKLVVFTGVSGSGKSSLAFDTIYAEGQRRYVESLSTYARQFLGIMEKPDVDSIEGLSPSISIDQKTTSRNPRSTVGTVTEIYDYLRLLFARVGHPHCPLCGREISQQSLDLIVEKSLALIAGEAKKSKKAWYLVLSPVVRDRKGEFSSLFDNLKAKGYRRVRVDGYLKDLAEELILIKTNKHTIEVEVDRLSLSPKNLKDRLFSQNLKGRLGDSLRQALNLSDGNVVLAQVLDAGFEMPLFPKKFANHLFSEKFACPVDNIQLPEIEPRTFSFNSPHGACPSCSGIGKILKVDPNLVFSDELSVREGGILPLASMFEHDTWYSRIILTVCQEMGIDTRKALGQLTRKEKEILLYGTGYQEYKVEGTNRFGRMTHIWEPFYGIVHFLERRHAETESDFVRWEIEKYMRQRLCETCQGTRLKKEALGITIAALSIAEVTAFSITAAANWIAKLEGGEILNAREKEIGRLILKEIALRLEFLKSVGLEYLTLDREAGTLSGGEAQRIRLASQIGSGLTGVLYVLDEPTIGLHLKDNQKLIGTLKKLRDLGNSVIVVEHDREMIKESDYVVDFGPQAGKWGGQIVATGTPKDVARNVKSLTGQYLSGKKRVEVTINSEKSANCETLKILGAKQFNLKNLDINFPLSKFIVVTGVSGSGKSTLLVETLYPALMQKLNPYFRGDVGIFKKLEGGENIDKVILIDQSPIGRTPRSNPATYTKVFDPIRDVFAATHSARALGFKKGQFSFNVRGGRCEACEGQGQIRIEMQFMSDIWVTCDVCHGRRYNSQTLEIAYKGKNVAEILEMTVSEAKEFFHAHPAILSKLETLEAVGLGYIHLGQAATTLSGGEAQRVKLATELGKKGTGKTLYLLDEPTTGLHFADVAKLLTVLKLLVAKGNTVIVIEHNFDVIRNSDWIIDLGPEGGDAGGELVAEGPPQKLKVYKTSYTAEFLKPKS